MTPHDAYAQALLRVLLSPHGDLTEQGNVNIVDAVIALAGAQERLAAAVEHVALVLSERR